MEMCLKCPDALFLLFDVFPKKILLMTGREVKIHNKLLICFALITAILLSFWQVKDFNFINLDDLQYVTENPHVLLGLNLKGIAWAFSTTHASNWHPLTWLSHMLDVQLFGLNAGWHHLVNVFFHIINMILLFLIFNRMTRALWPSAFVAALFALHPLHVESVAWVSERKDVLSTFFWMLTMGAYVFYVEKPDTKKYLLTLLFFALGLMAKPMLVTLPFVLLLLDYWPLGRLQIPTPSGRDSSGTLDANNPGAKKKKSKKSVARDNAEIKKTLKPLGQWPSLLVLIKEKIPFFALSAASAIVTLYAQKKGGAVGSLDVLPFNARMANAIVSYADYIEKMIWPRNLAVFYPHPGIPPGWLVLGSALTLLIITVLVLRSAKRFPYLVTGWLWYLGTLVPVIGLVQVGLQAMADRYTYVPLIGLFVIIAWGVPELTRKWRHQKILLAVSTGVILLILMFNTWSQARYWQNSPSLFEHAIRVTADNYVAHNNLGVALARIGEKEKAAFHYSEAIRMKPNFENAHFNLGNYLASQGMTSEAIVQYSEAIRIKPNYSKARNNLGAMLASQGKFQEAIVQYEKALQTEPANASFYYNLGMALASMNRYDEAINRFREALLIQPNYAEVHNDLGMVLAIQGKTGEAIAHFREALLLKPGFAPARQNLNRVLQTEKKPR
jgi:Flp pilus assembly protein TadD